MFCGKAECRCEVSPYVAEQRRRLDEGVKRMAQQTPEEVNAIYDRALFRATSGNGVVVDFDPPSYTRWSREVEEDRMREHLT